MPAGSPASASARATEARPSRDSARHFARFFFSRFGAKVQLEETLSQPRSFQPGALRAAPRAALQTQTSLVQPMTAPGVPLSACPFPERIVANKANEVYHPALGKSVKMCVGTPGPCRMCAAEPGAGDGGKAFRRCARCKRADYCSDPCQRAHWQEHKTECIATPLPFPERSPPYLDAGGSQPSPASKELPQREPAISSQQGATQRIEAPHAGGSAARLPPDFCSPYVVEAFKAEQKQLRSIILSNQEKSAADT